MIWEACQDKQHPEDWRAEASDFESEGECYVVIFCGWDAEKLAREYVAWKNQGAQ